MGAGNENTLSLELAAGYNNGNSDANYRDDFLLYLRNVDEYLNDDVSSEK